MGQLEEIKPEPADDARPPPGHRIVLRVERRMREQHENQIILYNVSVFLSESARDEDALTLASRELA